MKLKFIYLISFFLICKELQKYIQVDVFGACGDKNCPFPVYKAEDYTRCKSFISQKYKFYLSFENSLCYNYVTEKVFGMYENNNMMIPVVRSAPNVAQFLPNGTYIQTSKFSSPEKLAEYLKKVGSSEEMFTKILKEKHAYKVTSWMESYSRAICQMCNKIKHFTKVSTPKENLYSRLMVDTCINAVDI